MEDNKEKGENKNSNVKASFMRYLQGVYTKSDADIVLKETRSESGQQMIEKEMDNLWSGLVDIESSEEQHLKYKAEAKQLLKQLQKQNKQFSLRPFLKYAAAVAFLILLGTGIYFFSAEVPQTEQAIAYVDIRVKKGENKEVVLPDSTTVILNAGSFLRYPVQFATDIRLVEIDGEALFDVSKNKNHPFIVRTSQADIRVLGTSFNVKAYNADEQLLVSVLTGKVQVNMPEAMLRLQPNEQLMLDKSKDEFQKRNEDANRVKSWVNGGLYFNRTPIRGVARELERIYNCTIEFAPGFVFDEYIYGEHDNERLESVLNSIEYATNIKYRKEEDKYILYR